MRLHKIVQITEVGMRDGFQMESQILPIEVKVEIGIALIAAGLRHIEATSFVSAQAVPQLADAADLIAKLKGRGAELRVLVPNVAGAKRAAAAAVNRITVFASASETHNLKNVRRTVSESLAGMPEIGQTAREAGIAVNGAVSTAFGCPFEGDISTEAVLRVVDAYVSMGADSVSLADTTGMATPVIVESVVGKVRQAYPELPIALHFHNTRGLGLVNVMSGLALGIDRFESSIGGLGGCPFAPGATGNICTEDLIYMLDELSIETGVDLSKLIPVAKRLEELFGRVLPGQVMKAGRRLTRVAGGTGQ